MNTDDVGIEYINAAVDNSPWGGAMIQDSLLIGHSELSDTRCTTNGLLLPFSSRLTVKNVTFVNFNETGCRALGTCTRCLFNDGGAIVRTANLEFINSPNKVSFPFHHATAISDLDGSLTGHPNSTVVPTTGNLDPVDCIMKSEFSIGLVNGSFCKITKFAKVSWNNLRVNNYRISYSDVHFENKHGIDVITRNGRGYTSFLPIGEEVVFSFSSSTLTNISYNMEIDELPPNQFAYIKTKFLKAPDHISTIRTLTRTNNTHTYPLGSNFRHGDWYFNGNTSEMTYLIKSDINYKALTPPTLSITLNVYRCFFFKCIVPIPPPIPSLIPPHIPGGRSENITRDWSDPESWDEKRLPAEMEDVYIKSTWWMILDMDTPVSVDRLFIYGTLELEPSKNHDLKANIIMVTGINGRLIVGWPDNPMPNNVIIQLTGNRQSRSELNVGSKALGIFGHVMMYGKKHNVHWTRLEHSLQKG